MLITASTKLTSFQTVSKYNNYYKCIPVTTDKVNHKVPIYSLSILVIRSCKITASDLSC